MAGEVEKEGVDTGRFAINPFSGERVPIWVANFVLADYGTGAIMAVPFGDQRDFEFATKYGLPIRAIVAPKDGEAIDPSAVDPATMTEAWAGYGRSINSGEFSGLPSEEAWEKMADHAEAKGIGRRSTQYRLKDWGISRQRYWGTPIPVVHCPVDGIVAVPDDQLPVELPKVEEFTGQGDSPLAQIADWVNVPCPKCGGPARRETDTMDTFVDSSWYFYRFCDPKNSELPFAPDDGALLGPGRLLQRRRRARHPPPDLLAVLLPRVPRPRLRRSRRAVRAPADAGHGAQGRQRDVEVEGERGRPRRHDPEVRRRRPAPLRDVRGAAGEGGRVERLRPRRQLPVPGPRVARRRASRRSAMRPRQRDQREGGVLPGSSSTMRTGRSAARRTRRSSASPAISTRART